MTQNSPTLQSLLLEYRKLFKLVDGGDTNTVAELSRLEEDILKRLKYTHPDLSEEERVNMMVEFAQQ